MPVMSETVLDVPVVACTPRGPSWQPTLNDLPESWIPMGISRCLAVTPWGAGAARVCRTPGTLEIAFDDSRLPLVRLMESDDGVVLVDLRRAAAQVPIQSMSAAMSAHCNGEGRVHFVIRPTHGECLDLALTL